MADTALASWNDGPAKQAIIDFVTAATQQGPGFVPVADRIATFDNDGTLWVEQPMPPQFDFVFRRWGEEVKADPSLAGQQPYKAIIEKDAAFFRGVATQDPGVVATLEQGFARSWAGTTPEEFEAQVREWCETVKQPKLGRLYVQLVYKPMLELLDLLTENEFRVFVCSGGGRDFMRVFAEETWGIYKENVIGSAAGYSVRRRQDRPHARGSWGPRVGRGQAGAHLRPRPAGCPHLRAGTPMSISRCSKPRHSRCSSTTTTASASSRIRRRRRSRSRQRRSCGWTVVSMKNDWTTIFYEERDPMSDLTAIDILVNPDDAAIAKAHAFNARMRESVPSGFALDATHQPHITTLQRYVRTADLGHVYDAVEQTINATDVAALGYEVAAIGHADWGVPGQGLAALVIKPSAEVLAFQANLLTAVTPYLGSDGTPEAFVRDPGEEISQSTMDWVQNYVPHQIGAKYIAHLTVGFGTLEDLEKIEAEPFDAFPIHPASVAVYHLGNSGAARTQLAAWQLNG